MIYEWESTVKLIKNIDERINECLRYDFINHGHTYRYLLQSLNERLGTMNLEYLYYEDYLDDNDFAKLYKIFRNIDYVPDILKMDFSDIY